MMDIALATKIEEVVHWQPSKDTGPLTGTPENDPRFAYIRYDD
jgi:4a-hydroxytetrahydrobiopterin dehydratase